MNRLGWLIRAMRKPVETSMFIYSTGLLVFSAYLIIIGTGPTVIETAFQGQRIAEVFLGTIFLVLSGSGIMAPFFREEERYKWLKRATFSMFLAFLFLFILRVVVAGWEQWLWMYPLLLCLSSGCNRLYLEVRRDD